ncbi:hypothetical protein TEQG_01010 [Trichophyton equinum CBS 127.97]|uniref:Uncharacterized protein n=1 Tax=Trichophyton equinum (strain ATCC MYA-4606 / CBS 127.97) TaxID=559882 RepID=F2PJA2_TRIEC|nr:hypothetical protein TEQG_01010 [Trichophyton equinum CBS 127.97]
MDFVNKMTGGGSKEGGSSQNDMLNKGIDAGQKQFFKAGEGANDNINKGIDAAQGAFLGATKTEQKTEDKPTEEKK